MISAGIPVVPDLVCAITVWQWAQDESNHDSWHLRCLGETDEYGALQFPCPGMNYGDPFRLSATIPVKGRHSLQVPDSEAQFDIQWRGGVFSIVPESVSDQLLVVTSGDTDSEWTVSPAAVEQLTVRRADTQSCRWSGPQFLSSRTVEKLLQFSASDEDHVSEEFVDETENIRICVSSHDSSVTMRATLSDSIVDPDLPVAHVLIFDRAKVQQVEGFIGLYEKKNNGNWTGQVALGELYPDNIDLDEPADFKRIVEEFGYEVRPVSCQELTSRAGNERATLIEALEASLDGSSHSSSQDALHKLFKILGED